MWSSGIAPFLIQSCLNTAELTDRKVCPGMDAESILSPVVGARGGSRDA